MPSKRKSPKRKRRRSRRADARHAAFFPLLILSFIFWFIYRGVFQFSVLFDELIGKAIFFGLPVWLYILISGFQEIADTFAAYKIRRGLMMGIAIGGIFAFIVSLMLVWRDSTVYPSFAFVVNGFWYEFLLALLTGFWESLFFFSFVMLVAQRIFRQWSLFQLALFASTIFLVFHLPNIALRFQGVNLWYQTGLLALFALGQSLLFAKEKNGYSLVISHALWGMVLLFHF